MDSDKFTEQSDKITSQYLYCFEQLNDGIAPRLYARIMLAAAANHKRLDDQFYKELESEYPDKFKKVLQQRRESRILLENRKKEEAKAKS